MKELMGNSCFFVGKNKIRFAYMGDGKFRLFFWIRSTRSMAVITYRPGFSGSRLATGRTEGG